MEGYMGQIILFAGNYAPQQWLPCDGRLLPINDYQALYSLIGVKYGGDGRSTFGLPDLRARLPIGMGQSPGLSNRVLAQKLGEEVVSIAINQIPAHSHAFMAAPATADAGTPGNNAVAATANGDLYYLNPANPPQAAVATAQLNAGMVQPPDDFVNQPHFNLMPTLALNYIICVVGLYPQRS